MEDTTILQTPSSHCHAAAQGGTREDAALPSKQVPSIRHGLGEAESAPHPQDTCGPPSHFWMVPHPWLSLLPTLLQGPPRPEAVLGAANGQAPCREGAQGRGWVVPGLTLPVAGVGAAMVPRGSKPRLRPSLSEWQNKFKNLFE